MTQLRVLFADDHIPDDDVADENIREVVTRRYPPPDWPENIDHYFVAAREAVKTWRDAGYEVIVANTYRGVLHLIQENRFDIAIIDLTWSADLNLEKALRGSAGWQICAALRQFR